MLWRRPYGALAGTLAALGGQLADLAGDDEADLFAVDRLVAEALQEPGQEHQLGAGRALSGRWTP